MANRHLNEKKYQKNRKKLNLISLIIIITSIILGGLVMYLGYNFSTGLGADTSIVKLETDNVKETVLTDGSIINTPTNKTEYDQAIADLEAKYADDNSFEANRDKNFDLNRINSGYESFISTSGMKDSFNNSASQMTSGFNGIFKVISSIFFVIPGLIIMGIGLFIGGQLFLLANGRSIFAFFFQAGMPVAKEAGKELAPVFGNIAKHIADGVIQAKSSSKRK